MQDLKTGLLVNVNALDMSTSNVAGAVAEMAMYGMLQIWQSWLEPSSKADFEKQQANRVKAPEGFHTHATNGMLFHSCPPYKPPYFCWSCARLQSDFCSLTGQLTASIPCPVGMLSTFLCNKVLFSWMPWRPRSLCCYPVILTHSRRS